MPLSFFCRFVLRGLLCAVALWGLASGSSRAAPGAPVLDSLLRQAQTPQLSDTARVLLLCRISDQYWARNTDSAAAYADRALALARRTGYRHGEGEALNRQGAALRESNLARALELFQASLRLAQATHDRALQAQNLRSIGIIYVYLRDRQVGLSYYFQALRLGQQLRDEQRQVLDLSNIGLAYDLYNQLDSAGYYQQQAYAMAQRLHSPTNYILYGLGQEARKQGRVAEALGYYRRSIAESKRLQHLRCLNFAYVGLAALYQQQGRPDSSIYYARLGYQAAQSNGFLRGVLNASTLLTQQFTRRGPVDSAFKYQGRMLVMKDTLFGQEKVMRLQSLDYRERQRAQQATVAQQELRARYQKYALLGGMAALLALVGLLGWHQRQQGRANAALQASLVELKQTQAQLVQREKMAFLGELTAGVAHELQNPLGFVKQFAAAGTDLLAAINGQQRLTGDGALDREILDGLKDNLLSISQHGQRATAIIRGMLDHARTGHTPRQPTDLNALAAEQLGLAYEGLRQQFTDFEARRHLDLAPQLPVLHVAAQDLGRALLNLCTNAFYAARQRQQAAAPGYLPTVTLRTRPLPDGGAEVQVQDNGVGMSPAVQAQVFEAFFTTKPVGEGTGLGLALSHDIVTTGHGGTLTLQSEEGVGTTFTITLPGA
ncbi:histidine kinase [Hymenobacter sp. 15J16-1T3B]|uniref:ATP-binding protein n=1 Tax=Hymenobacter sp. 15J16-1T3B TaxID=2886941 RepID=UPI001D1171F1|nr:ATP-binding protein [Hymenobacter sp. 15J16-1T3B]MCC3160808.1 histidine kinase [Hymenobacter sp. 15J16-1T3B]